MKCHAKIIRQESFLPFNIQTTGTPANAQCAERKYQQKPAELLFENINTQPKKEKKKEI